MELAARCQLIASPFPGICPLLSPGFPPTPGLTGPQSRRPC